MPRLRPIAITAAALLLPAAIGGFVAQEHAAHADTGLLDEVMSLVATRYVDTVSASALYEKAARGLVAQLNDPYSELFSPTELKRFASLSTGQYGGIGMQIEDQNGQIVVVRVYRHTPAGAAGVLEGDQIVQIDTTSTRGWTPQKVSDVLIGQIGTHVTVRFARPGVAKPIVQTFTRAAINVPAVPYALMLDRHVAYVPLQSFNESSASDTRAAIDRLRRQGATSIILDLRNDPGGILDQGLDVASLFLRPGQEIASVRTRTGPPQLFDAKGTEHLLTTRLIVLVNGYSASASEIVTGALQDHDRALVVGTTSFGKGLVQTVFPLDSGWAMKLTTGKWYTPSGRSIQKERKFVDGHFVVDSTPPDSLETDSAKRNRPVYHSDAGRVVYGGGGITPDVVVHEDTATLPEQHFAQSIAPQLGLARSILYGYALQLKDSVRPDFTVTPRWRQELLRRLRAAHVHVAPAQYDSSSGLIDRWLGGQVARMAFGDSAEFRRDTADDPQLMRALHMLDKGQTQRQLFSFAQAHAATGPR